MKKKYLIIIFLSLFAFGRGFGMETGNDISGEIQENIQPINENFGSLGFEFCDGGSSFKKTIKPGEENEICLKFTNSTNQDIMIDGEFTDGLLDNIGHNACGLPGEEKDKFHKFISSRSGSYLVKKQGTTILKAKVIFPLGIQGEQKGCFAYSQKGTESGGGGGMFTVRYRSAYYLSFLVLGDFEGKNKINFEKISTDIQDGKNILITFGLANNGSLNNEADVNLKISNAFGFSKEFSWTGLKLETLKNRTINLSTKDFPEKIELPRYKGPFKIEVTAKYKPFFDFDISNSGIDPKVLEEQTINQSKSIFIFPTLPAIGLLIAIILIYFALFRKPKVIYVQQQVPTNTIQQ